MADPIKWLRSWLDVEKDWNDTIVGIGAGESVEAAVEALIARIDPELFERDDPAGWFLRKIAAMDSVKRHAAFTTIGSVIMASRLPEGAKLLIGRPFMAMAPGIDSLLKNKKIKVENIEKKLKEAYDERKKELEKKDDDLGEAWCDNDARSQIHLTSVHAPPKDRVDDVVKGSLTKVRFHCARSHHHCLICFSDLAGRDLRVPDTAATVVIEDPSTPLEAMAELSPAALKFVTELNRLAVREQEHDLHIGLEGRAHALTAAIANALQHNPVALEDLYNKIFTAGPPDLEPFLFVTPEEALQRKNENDALLLPDVVEQYITALLLAYHIEHPPSALRTEAADLWDKMFEKLPESVRPTQKGFAGVRELRRILGEIWGLIPWPIRWPLDFFLVCLCVLLIFVIFGAFGTIVFSFLGGVGAILAFAATMLWIFSVYFSFPALVIQCSALMVWFARLILVTVDTFLPGSWYQKWKTRDMTKEEAARYKTEPVRSKLLTIGMATGVIGLVVTPVLGCLGYITHPGIILLTMALWALLMTIDGINKWMEYVDPEQKKIGVRRFMAVGLALFATCAILGFGFFVFAASTTATAMATLSSEVVDQKIEQVAVWQGIPLTPRIDVCLADREYHIANKERKEGLKPGTICSDPQNSTMWPCNCDALIREESQECVTEIETAEKAAIAKAKATGEPQALRMSAWSCKKYDDAVRKSKRTPREIACDVARERLALAEDENNLPRGSICDDPTAGAMWPCDCDADVSKDREAQLMMDVL